MSYTITDACINCAACVPVCPNNAISKGSSLYEIEMEACTECVGFFSRPQCAKVCPMDCCIVDPNMMRSEEALFERAKVIHANSEKQPTLTPATSHFRRAAASTQKAPSGKWWERIYRSLTADG